jgi:hypothetical protein
MGKFGLNLRKRQRALLLGFEQTRVFDRDHCLVGKVLEKRDLTWRRMVGLPIAGLRLRPIGAPSRNNGVASMVRWPWRFASLLPAGNSFSSAARLWT